jgi:predicted metal-dependent phosphoesterase TrpH
MMGKADLHTHTCFSDGLDNPREMVRAAHREGLQVIAVTDHDTLEGAIRAREYSQSRPDLGVEVIVGEEISTTNGHMIGLFLKTLVPPRLSAKRTVELIHQQGGLAILAHPFHPFTGKFPKFPRATELIEELHLDGIETLNNGEFYGPPFNAKAAKLCRQKGFAAVGSSDAHKADFVGMAYTEFPGRSSEDLRTALMARTTRAAASRSWSVMDILRHLKNAGPVLYRFKHLSPAA